MYRDLKAIGDIAVSLIQLLQETARTKDRRAANKVVRALTRTLSAFQGGIQAFWRAEVSLASANPRMMRWERFGPEEALNILRVGLMIDEAIVELKQQRQPYAGTAETKRLAQIIVKTIRSMRKFAKETRDAINRLWPGYWTSTHDQEFSKYLE